MPNIFPKFYKQCEEIKDRLCEQFLTIIGGGKMRKSLLLAIPAIAIIALVGLAAAQPFFWANPQNMTSQEKSVQLQMLNEQQSMIQDQKDYLNGVITQEQFQDKLDQHQQTMLTLRQQMRDALRADPNFQNSTISGCPMGGHFGKAYGYRMHGHGMMWGW